MKSLIYEGAIMEIIYKYRIDNHMFTKNIDNNINAVIRVLYCTSGSDGVNTAEHCEVIHFGAPNSENFIPFDQLTEDQVIAWVQQILPEERKNRSKQAVVAMLQHKRESQNNMPEPPSIKDAPWLKSVEN